MISQRRELVFAITLAIGLAGCSHLAETITIDPFALPTDYISQQRIVLQGFSNVQTMHGSKAAVYFGYDRDKRYVKLPDNSWVSVDLIEFKLIEHDKTWRWEPFVVISDDDFDGYADRLFVDVDFDGVFETIFDIRVEKRVIDKMGLEEINPWLLGKEPEKMVGESIATGWCACLRLN
jgi:hypothetical protein